MHRHGMILFGHGARDPHWAEPFLRLAAKLRAARGVTQPVALAFLEQMEPSLPEAVAMLAAQRCSVITVVPIFLGQGGHIKRDLPRIIDVCRAAHPGLDLRCAAAIGEDDHVLDAITAYCVRQSGETR